MKYCNLWWIGLSLLAIPLFGQRQITNFNEGWLYLENNLADVTQLPRQAGSLPVSLPHTWNQWDATDNLPGYRRDASWYKKELNVKEPGGRRYLLYFEGANIKTKVYVNEQLAGEHIGGYVGFKIDLTPFVRAGKNTIAVRVDNGYDPNVIPSQKSDFFIYGGITRDVWLMALPTTYIENVLISTPSVSKRKAETSIKVSIRRQEAAAQASGTIRVQAIEPGTNEIVARKEMPFNLSGELAIAELQLPEIQNPSLWSPEAPHLYRLLVQYLENGVVHDEIEEAYGYRWYYFEPHGAFYLNGERLLLRGTHRHEEHAGYGAAMPNYLHRQDMAMIKEMGANFVRLGHYPQDPEVYKACNELGLIVWDELPWCRGGVGPAEWKTNTRRLLQEQILQNYNHPSILFWSLGNEIYWLPDFPEGGDTAKISAFVSELHEQAHRLDPHRLTAIRKYYSGAGLVDVFSPSIWSGWYAGVYTNYEQALNRERKKYPRFLHMEYGGSSHPGRHTENPVTGTGLLNEGDWAEVANQVDVKNVAKEGDWTENYIVGLFDWHLSVSETADWFAGNAQWAFKDFGTPLRPENAIPFVNQKGLVDRAGNPKDAYYVFKSYWAKQPFAYILIAYRFYLDSRHRSDIYGKRVSGLVMDTVGWQYHDIMDWGSDILKVGNSLGIGSPAIWYQDSLYTLSDTEEKVVEITDAEPGFANIRTTFRGLHIGGHTFSLVQDWSLQAGDASSGIKLKVIDGALPEGMAFATGIAKHLDNCQTGASSGRYYAYTWGKQSFHGENMGMAVVIPQEYGPEKIKNADSHAFLLKNAGSEVNYRFLAAWERDVMGIKDEAGFYKLVEKACQK